MKEVEGRENSVLETDDLQRKAEKRSNYAFVFLHERVCVCVCAC
jgi:hypothetical protein